MAMLLLLRATCRNRVLLSLALARTATATRPLASKTADDEAARSSHHGILSHASAILVQNITLLSLVKNNVDYTKVLPAFYGASIASHFRHMLDHYTKCLDALECARDGEKRVVKYDERERGTLIETSRFEAKKEARRLLALIEQQQQQQQQMWEMDDEICVSFMFDPKTKSSYYTKSTAARELSFVAHHATHHLAMVSIMMDALGIIKEEQGATTKIGLAVSTQALDETTPIS